MNIENQCSTRAQSRRLVELGITPDSSYLVHCTLLPDPTGEKWYSVILPRDIELGNVVEQNAEYDYPAFTVAELGVMIPCDSDGFALYSTSTTKLKEDSGFSILDNNEDLDSGIILVIDGVLLYKTEAEARAALLIYMLEKNILTPEEANQRLTQS